KGEMAVHPLCEQLVAAHVGCLRVATPIDHLPLIDAQLAQSSGLLHSYSAHHRPFLSPHDKQELDSFLAQYLMLLCSFREQLQQHVRVHAVEAVMACREIEQSLQDLTGASLEEGMGATMSEDEDEGPPMIMEAAPMDMSSNGHDMMGFGPLVPTDTERSLMERVRQELKIELKQVLRIMFLKTEFATKFECYYRLPKIDLLVEYMQSFSFTDVWICAKLFGILKGRYWHQICLENIFII
uniref:KNOX2 domain-containing protein n=1 Tax=Aegilops tauschii subsp. strangulata TaxID=200361 RepID=A0A453J5V0_AEGTS